MRIAIVLFFLLFICSICNAQKETSHWFFNGSNYIKFNPGGGVTNQASPNLMFSNNAGASIADTAGNLLFFATAFMVYDRNNTPMPSYSNPLLIGNDEMKIAPVPGQPNKYYLFYTYQVTYPGVKSLRYSIIDMSLRSGLGDVVAQHVPIDSNMSSVYTLISKPSSPDYWIVTHRTATDSFFCRLVSSSGINSMPVISTAGMNATKSEYSFMDLRPSHDGKMLAGFCYTNYTVIFAYTVRFIEVFNFDGATGTISNKVKTRRQPGYFTSTGSIEFSPDNKLLYALDGLVIDGLQPCGFGSAAIKQYNLCYTDSTKFTDSSMTVGSRYTFCWLVAWGKMQMGRDKKIYFPYAGTNILSRIEYPNRIGSSCTVNDPYHSLVGQTGWDIPKFYHRYTEKAVKNNIVYSGGCFPNPIQFNITNDTITSFQWDFGDPVSGAANTSTLQSPQHQFSTPGIYAVTANLYNSNGQLIETLNELVEIKNPATRLLAPLPTDTTVCRGTQIKLKVNALNAIFEWQYRDTLGYIYSEGIADSIYTQTNEPGTYIVKMKQNGCDACTLIDSIAVHMLPKPDLNLGYDRNLCTGDSIQLHAYNPGATFLWSTGETTESIWVSQGGTYSVRAEFNNNGCPSYDTIVITQRPSVQFSLPSDTTLCSSQTLLLSPGIANANYYWQNGSNASTFTVTQPGIYWVRVSNQYGCVHSDTITVGYVNAQAVNLGADTSLCIGSQLILNLNIPNASYLWSNGSTAASIAVNNTGLYWINVNNGACTATDSIQVIFAPIPVINLGNDTAVCMQAKHTLRATVANATYLWQNGSTADTFNVFQPGVYWVKVSRFGCSYSDTINVTYKPLPSLNLGPDISICTNQSIILQAGNPSIQSYLWNTGSTNNSISVAAAGNYWVQVTGTNQCINRDTVLVSLKPLPQFSLGNDTSLCQNQVLLLQANLNNATYLWSNGSQTNQFTVSQPGTYWLDVTQIGCTKRDSININYNPLPTVNLGNDTTLCEGITKTLDASNPSSVYIWQNGSGGSSFTVNTAGLYYVAVNMNNCIKRDSIVIGYTYKPAFDLGKDTFICQGHQIILTPKLTGSFNYVWQDGSNNSTYTVNQPGSYQLTASNNCGSFTDKIVIDKGTCLLLMPNAFTPNNDGLNDLFRVKYPGFIKSFKMTVYNRWGEKIFETTNALTGWNGKYKGLDQPMGNYIWIISYTDIDGRSETLKGNVILIR